MDRLTNWLEEKFAPPLIKFSNFKYVQILQRTFVSFTALLLVGSLMLLIQQLPINNWKEIIGENTINLLGKITGVGTSYISLYVVVATSYYTLDYYNKNKGEDYQPIPAILLAIISFVILNPSVAAFNEAGEPLSNVLNISFYGSKGIFGALLIAIITVEVYRFFIKHNITIKLPDGVPPMIFQAFAAIIPTLIVILGWWALRYILNIDLLQLTIDLFQPLVRAGDNWFAVIIIPLLNRALWTVGVHGGSVVGAVANPILSAMTIANQTAAANNEPLVHIASGVFYDSYVWNGLAPLAIALMMSKSKKLRAIGAIGLIPAIFNIGEPLMFGVPIVMNPILAIPFVFSYVIVSVIAYGLCAIGVLPIPYITIPWTMPGPIKAFLSSGAHLGALVWGIVSWIIVFIIFYPFVKALEQQDIKEQEG